MWCQQLHIINRPIWLKLNNNHFLLRVLRCVQLVIRRLADVDHVHLVHRFPIISPLSALLLSSLGNLLRLPVKLGLKRRPKIELGHVRLVKRMLAAVGRLCDLDALNVVNHCQVECQVCVGWLAC
jgi:hypothetical protein